MAEQRKPAQYFGAVLILHANILQKSKRITLFIEYEVFRTLNTFDQFLQRLLQQQRWAGHGSQQCMDTWVGNLRTVNVKELRICVLSIIIN